ncbi:MAG: amino acid decarboxylase [Acidobacteriaceae bacterium]|nr:amino acid decarboxylase [Acidobacteriaceae bacterium]
MHDVDSFRPVAREAIEWIADYLANSRRYPVTPRMRPGDLIDRLPAQGPETGEPLAQLLADFEAQILPAVGHWNHPRFFNYFSSTGSVPGVLAEMLAAALNSNGINWVATPAVSELEQVALAWLRQWSGLPEDYFGQIFDTASISTLHALAAAREMADPDSRRRGLTKRLRVYCSDQAHSSVDKAVIAVGIGLDNLIKIPTDAAFRLQPELLRQAIEADLAAGFTPCAVVATLGTTSTTSVDPIREIVDLAAPHNLWVHIDAAYAGAALLLPEFASLLQGAERAHSYVVNPHKWLFVPVDCSAFYTRFPEILRRAFTVTPEYLRTTADPRAVNLMDYGIPLGRRFRGLKLWFVLRYFGRQGLIAELRRQIELAQRLRRYVEADGRFELAAPAPFSTVCFRKRAPAAENRWIAAEINRSGDFFISQTLLREQFTLRVAVGNLATTEADIDALWERLTALAALASAHSGG